jgi:AcrR family transcriptional regulator
MSPGRRTAPDRARQLFDAACELFAEHGYHEVDVADIAEHAGVSSGTFYNYYSNKRALLDDILRTYVDLYAAEIDLVDEKATVVDRSSYAVSFEDMIRRLLSRIAENAPVTSFLCLTAPGIDQAAYASAVDAYTLFSSKFRAFFERGRDRGWVRDDINLTVAGQAAMSCVIVSVSPMLLGDHQKVDIDLASKVVATYLLSGMRDA